MDVACCVHGRCLSCVAWFRVGTVLLGKGVLVYCVVLTALFQCLLVSQHGVVASDCMTGDTYWET